MKARPISLKQGFSIEQVALVLAAEEDAPILRDFRKAGQVPLLRGLRRF
jgi:hypothetical protein